MKIELKFWHRLLATMIVMLLASYLASLIWSSALGFRIPSYISGLIGGLSALPIWDQLKRFKPTQDKGAS